MSVVRVPLRGLGGGHYALVDELDLPKIEGYVWHVCKPCNVYYARGRKPKKACGIPMYAQSPVFMHRLILPAAKGIEVDHIDRNGLNNSRSNLRHVSAAENQWNRPVCGHVFPAKEGKWRANIRVARRRLYLGTFQNKQLAEQACKDAAAKHRSFGGVS